MHRPSLDPERMLRCCRTLIILYVLLFHPPATTPAKAQPTGATAEAEARKAAVESGLLPAVLLEGRDTTRFAIHDRMQRFDVPGLSIAVINDGRIEWTDGYGVKRAGSTDSVDTSTLFQAASISKPVAATSVLRLVHSERVSLDADVNDLLTSWQVPTSGFTTDQKVTLRRLLSHTAGTTVHGFPGYGKGEVVPSAVEVLGGRGNTDPVVVDTLPGSIWRYSGGGYTIAQLAVADVTEMPFEAFMSEAVLEPFGMSSSTFEQPLPDHLAGSVATAHGWSGEPVTGDWHTYPEQAAAGLWTTPTDLARFALEVARAYNGDPDAPLPHALAREMLTPVDDGEYGLGFGLTGEGTEFRFSHGGSNRGYRCFLALYPYTGDGIVVMTNADSGADLAMEVIRAVSDVYGWPHAHPALAAAAEIDPVLLEEYAGTYELPDGRRIAVRAAGDQLMVDAPMRHSKSMYPESDSVFFGTEVEMRIRFDRDGNGGVVSLTLLTNGEISARRID